MTTPASSPLACPWPSQYGHAPYGAHEPPRNAHQCVLPRYHLHTHLFLRFFLPLIGVVFEHFLRSPTCPSSRRCTFTPSTHPFPSLAHLLCSLSRPFPHLEPPTCPFSLFLFSQHLTSLPLASSSSHTTTPTLWTHCTYPSIFQPLPLDTGDFIPRRNYHNTHESDLHKTACYGQ